MCITSNFRMVERNEIIRFFTPPISRNANEQRQIDLILRVAGSWKERIARDQIEQIRSNPQTSFTVLISGNKKENIVKSFLTEARIDSTDLTDKCKPFLDCTVKKIHEYARKKIETAPIEVKEAANDWIAAKKIWNALKCPATVLEDHPKCAVFLNNARILTKIIGYKNSSHDPELKKGIQLAEDGHPLVLFLGQWTRVEDIENLLVFNPEKGELVSKMNPDQVWNYFPPNPSDDRFPGGLVPVDRFRDVFPIHKLSPEEYAQVVATGEKFFENNLEVDPGVPKPCFLQIFSTRRPNYGIPSTGIYENLNKQIPSHIAIRFIDGEGKVYSPSFEMNDPDAQVILAGLPRHLLATSNVNITALDYEEFRNFDDRMVTTIPVTQKRLDSMLATTKELTQTNIRFNYARQNCSNFAKLMLSHSGYSLDNSATFGKILWSILPPLKSIPVIGPTLDKVKQLARKIFSSSPIVLKKSLGFIAKALFYIPGRIGVVIQNVLFIILFGAMENSAVKHDRRHNNGYMGLENFKSLIGSWTEVFSDNPGKVSSAALFTEWQTKQKSTVVMPYQGTKFYITPDADPSANPF